MNTTTLNPRHILVAIFVAMLSATAQSQVIEDFGRITLKTHLPNRTSLPIEAANLLESKMREMVVSNGLASTDVNPRFVISAVINVLTKDVIPGPPQMISQNLEVAFSVEDVVEKSVFSTTRATIVGVGSNETKALMNAFKKINPTSPSNKALISSGKERIIAFYEAKCEDIIKTAITISQQDKYDEAIYNLALVPNICGDCYHRCLKLQGEFLENKIETEGRKAFQKAKTIWAQSPDKDAASQVANLLQQISPQVSFAVEVDTFINQVLAAVQAQQQQEWERQAKAWEQSVRKWEQQTKEQEKRYSDEVEQQKIQAQREHELERQRIRACKEIAVEYAKNQPKEIYNTLIIK